MGTRSEWQANRLEGARRRISALKREIEEAKDRNTAHLWQERKFLELEVGYLLHEMTADK
jgi:hypothetical protein